MFFEGKCQGIHRLAIGEPGAVLGGEGSYYRRGLDLGGWNVSGVLCDFTDNLDKRFLDDFDDDAEFDPEEMFAMMNEVSEAIDELDEEALQAEFGELEDEECNAENHFGLARGVKFVVALAAPGVKVAPRIDGTFEVLSSVYGCKPDKIRVHPIRSESGFVGICVDDMVDNLLENKGEDNNGLQWWIDDGYASLTLFEQPDPELRKVLPSMGSHGIVYEGIYQGEVRFLVIGGMVIDYDLRAQETFFQHLVEALRIDVCQKMVFDELTLVEKKLGLAFDFDDEDALDNIIEDAVERSDEERDSEFGTRDTELGMG